MRRVEQELSKTANVSVKLTSEPRQEQVHHIRSVKQNPKMTPRTGSQTGDGFTKDSRGGVPAGTRTRNLLLRSY